MPSPSEPPRGARCPICARPASPEQRPFCSQGCRDRDLLRWLGEGYRLPGRERPDGLDNGEDGPL